MHTVTIYIAMHVFCFRELVILLGQRGEIWEMDITRYYHIKYLRFYIGTISIIQVELNNFLMIEISIILSILLIDVYILNNI